ncbi:MAG: alpha/beta fold hydrolase [Pseudomonadota bacterium]
MYRFLVFCLTATLLVGVSVPAPVLAQEGRLRELIRERIQERRSARQEGQGQTAATARNGLQTVALTHDGRARSYLIAPETVAQGRPVVLVFHGGEGDGTRAALASGIVDDARAQGFAVAFPNSPGQQWNDGRETTRSGIDDVGFTRAVIADLGARYGLNTQRVYVAGISNGGMFVQRLACDAPDLVDAVAVVAAVMPAALSQSCAARQAKPMIFFNGTADRLMPFEGGEIASSRLLGIGVGGRVLSQAQTRSFWTARNACGTGNVGAPVDRVTDQTTAQLTRYRCAGQADLLFYVLEGGGHNWPGSSVGGASRLSGTVSREVDATATIIEFFKRYGL